MEQPGTEEPFQNDQSIEEEAVEADVVEPTAEEPNSPAEPHYEQVAEADVPEPPAEPAPVFMAADEADRTEIMAPPAPAGRFEGLPSADEIIAEHSAPVAAEIPLAEDELQSVSRKQSPLIWLGPVALVIALIALAGVLGLFPVKLASNSVGSKQIKPGSLTAGDFAPGQIPHGPAGPQGPAGSPGAVGPQGPQGPAGGLNTLQVVSATSTGGTTTQTALASCATGQKLVGGGGAITGTGASITTSAPQGTGWQVIGTPVANNKNSFTVKATAICALPSKTTTPSKTTVVPTTTTPTTTTAP